MSKHWRDIFSIFHFFWNHFAKVTVHSPSVIICVVVVVVVAAAAVAVAVAVVVVRDPVCGRLLAMIVADRWGSHWIVSDLAIGLTAGSDDCCATPCRPRPTSRSSETSTWSPSRKSSKTARWRRCWRKISTSRVSTALPAPPSASGLFVCLVLVFYFPLSSSPVVVHLVYFDRLIFIDLLVELVIALDSLASVNRILC